VYTACLSVADIILFVFKVAFTSNYHHAFFEMLPSAQVLVYLLYQYWFDLKGHYRTGI